MTATNTDSNDHDGDRLVDRAIAAVISHEMPAGLGAKVLDDAAVWSPTTIPERSKVLGAYAAVAAVICIAATLGCYFLWARNTRPVAPIAEQRQSDTDPEATTPQPAPNSKAGSMAGVYRPNFRGVVAANATVIVATGRDKPLPLGAYVPYKDGGDTLHIWDWTKSPTSRVMKNTRLWVHEMFAISPDGKSLVWPDGRILDLETGKQSKLDLGGEYYPNADVNIRRIKNMGFAPDGKRLAVLINDVNVKPSTHPLRERDIDNRGVIQLVSFPSGELLCEIPAGRLQIAFTPNSERVISAVPPEQLGQHLVEYDANTGAELRKFEPRLKDFAYAIKTSPDGKYVATHDGKVGLMIWESESGKLLHCIERVRHASYTRVLEFSPDSKYVAMDALSKVLIVDVTSGQIAGSFGQIAVAQIRWSTDGGTLTVVTHHHHYKGGPEHLYNHYMAVYAWDWRNGKRIKAMDSTPPR